jgi:outer membrane receptor protein involved in Fe transport
MGLENLKKSLLRAGGLLCLAALVSPGIASAASNEGDALEEIVVTANKRSESLDKVGSAIQVLSAATLDQQHVTSLQDLAAAVPGLTYTQSEYGTPVYTLRGVGFYDTSLASYPDVSVYLDQAPLPFPVQTVLTLFDMQRVEVLKGPQGTLFGNNATGGAINETSDYKWRFFLWGKNVTNAFYLTNVVQVGDAVIRYTGMPATWGLTVSYRH